MPLLIRMSALPKETEQPVHLRLTDDERSQNAHAGGLVARILKGDESAWPELIAMYTPRVFAMCRSRLQSAELAEEITQSVFVTLATKLGEGSLAYAEEGKFEPWLFRIAMNRVRDEARRAKRHARPTDPSTLSEGAVGVAEGAAASAHPETLDHLRSAVNLLSDQDKSIIELRHFASLSFQEIAALLEVPVGTALARHHRALKKLRTTLSNKGITDSFFE